MGRLESLFFSVCCYFSNLFLATFYGRLYVLIWRCGSAKTALGRAVKMGDPHRQQSQSQRQQQTKAREHIITFCWKNGILVFFRQSLIYNRVFGVKTRNHVFGGKTKNAKVTFLLEKWDLSFLCKRTRNHVLTEKCEISFCGKGKIHNHVFCGKHRIWFFVKNEKRKITFLLKKWNPSFFGRNT